MATNTYTLIHDQTLTWALLDTPINYTYIQYICTRIDSQTILTDTNTLHTLTWEEGKL